MKLLSSIRRKARLAPFAAFVLALTMATAAF